MIKLYIQQINSLCQFEMKRGDNQLSLIMKWREPMLFKQRLAADKRSSEKGM